MHVCFRLKEFGWERSDLKHKTSAGLVKMWSIKHAQKTEWCSQCSSTAELSGSVSVCHIDWGEAERESQLDQYQGTRIQAHGDGSALFKPSLWNRFSMKIGLVYLCFTSTVRFSMWETADKHFFSIQMIQYMLWAFWMCQTLQSIYLSEKQIRGM